MRIPKSTGLSFVAAALVAGIVAEATVLITIEEALDMAFPDATIERETLFLSADQQAAVQKLSGTEAGGGLGTRFVATDISGSVLGYAYLDTHRVRTLPETLMVVLDAKGKVRQVEVVTFREPLEYLPREGWYDQYGGAELDDDLALKRGIRPVTGATLTAVATTEAVRRVLAVHQVIQGGAGQ